MQQRRHHNTDQHAHDGVAHALHQVQEHGPFLERCRRGAHQIHADEQYAQAHAHHARLLDGFLFVKHHDHHDAHEGEHRAGVKLDGQKQRRYGRTNVRAHDDAHRLGQGQQLRVHEANHHHRCRTGGLNDGGHNDAGDERDKPVPRHQGEEVFQLRPRRVLQSFAHGPHSEEEEGQSSQQRQYTLKTHTCLLCGFFRLARRLISWLNPVYTCSGRRLVWQRTPFSRRLAGGYQHFCRRSPKRSVTIY